MSGFMLALITAIHVAACVALMATILLQSGKGGGLAGAFGAGSSQTLFGGRGAATFLSRAATVLAVTFFLTSLTLGVSAARRSAGPGKSLIQEEAQRRAAQRANAPEGGAPASAPTGAPAPGGASAPTPGGIPGALTPSSGAPAAPAQPTTAPAPAPATPTKAPAGGTPQGGGSK